MKSRQAAQLSEVPVSGWRFSNGWSRPLPTTLGSTHSDRILASLADVPTCGHVVRVVGGKEWGEFIFPCIGLGRSRSLLAQGSARTFSMS